MKENSVLFVRLTDTNKIFQIVTIENIRKIENDSMEVCKATFFDNDGNLYVQLDPYLYNFEKKYYINVKEEENYKEIMDFIFNRKSKNV